MPASLSAVISGDGRMPVVGRDDFAYQGMPYHIFRLKVGESDVVDAVQDAFDGGESRLGHGQIDLRHVSGDDHLGVETKSGEEHLHLLFRGVLRLIENHERIVERASTHVGERSDFDGAVIHIPLQLVGPKHVG